MRVNMRVNGEDNWTGIEPGDMLYEVLNRLGYKSVKKSCGTGCCGACTVLLDWKPVPSCSYLAIRAEGHDITTVEGISEEAEKIGSVLAGEGVVQCGYCAPGFVLTVAAMKREIECISEESINNYLSGNICRCSGYAGQLRAVKKYLGVSE